MFKFIYDVLVFITNNYSEMPDSFKRKFSEVLLGRARRVLTSPNVLDEIVKSSYIDFKDYE